MSTMNIPGPLKGVTLVAVERRPDKRGNIAIFGWDSMPFVPVRSFVISDVPPGSRRGGHALSCDELLWVAAGSCRGSFDNGHQKASLALESNDQGVLLSAGVWLELSDFSPGTVVFGFAPVPFAETRKFDAPRPDLIAARTRTGDPTG
jgi:hypothetical protein